MSESCIKALLELDSVQDLFQTLSFPTRLVGGCVRDALLNQLNPDIDVAVAAPPQAIIDALRNQNIKIIPTGIQFGSIVAFIGQQKFEITSLRKDIQTDGRHAKVIFGNDWYEDAKRRDFTINALYLDQEGTIFDYFGGVSDLKNGLIRFIGNPEKRTQEDSLRILRYYRFLAHFGRITPLFSPILKDFTPQLKKLSCERVQAETLKLLKAGDPTESLSLMKKDQVFTALYNQEIDLTLINQLIKLEYQAQMFTDSLTRLYALVYTTFMKQSDFYEKYFRLTTAQKRFLSNLTISLQEFDKRWVFYKYGYRIFKSWLLLRFCLKEEQNIDQLKQTLKWANIQTFPRFPLTGQYLLAQGLTSGPFLKTILSFCEKWWVENDFSPSAQECWEYYLSHKKTP